MIQMLIFAFLLVWTLVWVVIAIVRGIRIAVAHGKERERAEPKARWKNSVWILAVAIAASAVFLWLSQTTAFTPSIVDENGKEIQGSIAELRAVTLNGRTQWISLRGENRENPVLLFLAGGPGGTQMAAVRHELGALEKHFVVVNWDQPGSGKSYRAVRQEALTVETYIQDGDALAQYLCDTFGKEKIYLVGESWGSALGVFLVDKNPDRYYALMGTGQMIAFLETEKQDYQTALQMAQDRGDTAKVQKLLKNGEPPYYGSDVTWKSMEYLNDLSGSMARNPKIYNAGYNTFRDLFSEEYGVLDKINYLLALANTFNHVYPQLYDIDLRRDFQNLEVPVWFLLGRHDINAPTYFVEEYLDIVQAPHKEIIWFEHSGHSPWINEPVAFVQAVLQVAEQAQ